MDSAQAENVVNCSQKEIVRPVANFSPSLWGDQFIQYNFNTEVAEKYSQEIEVLKNEARNMLMVSGSKMVETMNLIDTLERLGLSYHFENEIEDKLQQFFNLNTNYAGEAYDLYTVALHFRLFRQHGYRISCDVFEKFKDENREFQEDLKTDARGLLSLYDAAQLRIHEEHILDSAFAFATANLKSLAPNLCSPLREQVLHDLEQQLHLGVPRVEARKFISIYEEDESKNEVLMKFAKLDYNLLQMLHKKELDEVSRWWKELEFTSKLPYARDRVVECFFWALGARHEPQYSRSRVMLAKTISMTSILDDTYDAYGTIEELDILTKAIDRWNITEIDRLPCYIRPFYKALLELYEQFEEELAEDGRSYATYYPKEALKELARSYYVEAKWFIQGYLPSFEEYLDNALITSTYYYHTTTSLLGTKSTTKEEFEWLSKKPKMLVAGLIICRVIDDIASYEVEKERGQIATGIECYMNENGVTKEVAMNKFYEIARNAWKDLNEECLRPFPCSRDVLMRILNLARTIELFYKNNEDGYTRPEKLLKPHIVSVLVDPIKI